jgi:hypothetical protein
MIPLNPFHACEQLPRATADTLMHSQCTAQVSTVDYEDDLANLTCIEASNAESFSASCSGVSGDGRVTSSS